MPVPNPNIVELLDIIKGMNKANFSTSTNSTNSSILTTTTNITNSSDPKNIATAYNDSLSYQKKKIEDPCTWMKCGKGY